MDRERQRGWFLTIQPDQVNLTKFLLESIRMED
jgi:hypothetical protein